MSELAENGILGWVGRAVSPSELHMYRRADVVALAMAKLGVAGQLEGAPVDLPDDLIHWIFQHRTEFQEAVEYHAHVLRGGSNV